MGGRSNRETGARMRRGGGASEAKMMKKERADSGDET